ncbi:histidine kinase [Ideonella margarita]|uniref:histidine kinase n=1 Tax=Ideonella margarita TaxID=2984191 RepID=A0ABU9C2A2_9BURK
MSTPNTPTSEWRQNWQSFSAAAVRGFHAYGAWLAGISWKRFVVLSVLLVIVVNIVQSLPPFSWTFTEAIVSTPDSPAPPKTPAPPPARKIIIDKPGLTGGKEGVDISIDENGVRIQKRPARTAEAAASAASGVAGAASGVASAVGDGASVSIGPQSVEISAGDQQVRINLPPGAAADDVREAVEEAKQAIVDAIEEARTAQVEAMQEAAKPESRIEHHTVRYGEFLTDLALLWIVASAIVKITYKGRIQAEVKAAQATETAEAESLRRQVVEARMAAMQAQVEPHFLFNTLASIDHLIETDPPRASQMQKNLIALLRASMPTMRETSDGGPRDLARELAVVRPYVEILKVRMEERLDAHIDVPDGLASAEFPAMMIQTLVENAIRHGLEPKAEGGQLRVKAEIVHGKLAVSVADTGVGFGNAATSGTGVGLANIRERLQMLYGTAASLTVLANTPSGTVVTVTVPYRTVAGAAPATNPTA